MSLLARPAAGVAVVVGLAFACTNTIEGLPLEDDFAGGGTAAGASVMNGGTTGSPSAGMTSVGGSAAPSGGVGTGGAPGLGGSGPVFTGGTSTGGASTGGTSTGGSGAAGSAQAGSGAGGFGGTAAAGGRAAGGTAGSGKAGSGAAGGPSTFAAASDIITRMCASAVCHGGRETPNLSPANLYTTLTSTAVRQCGNDRLVTPSDTANSAILQLVNGQCGNLVMPEGCEMLPCLDAPDIKTISDWIAAGAPR